MMQYPTAIVFGVFDRLHKGHEYFLSEAKALCGHLTVVVTLPEIVMLMKKKMPRQTLEERLEAIRNFDTAFNVVPGDATMGEWNVFEKYKPDIVLLGYDQQGIAKELDRLGMKYEYIDAHFPERYKSSLILE